MMRLRYVSTLFGDKPRSLATSLLVWPAEKAFRRAAALQPANPRARAGLEALETDRRHRTLLAEADVARSM